MVPECCVCHASLDVVCMYLSMVCGMFVCVSLSINVCMFTVSNALLMSNATAMVRVGGIIVIAHHRSNIVSGLFVYTN